MSTTRPTKDQIHAELWERAQAAGKQALAAIPRQPVDRWFWVYTSIIVKPGTSSFARYLARHHGGYRNTQTGGIEVACGSGDSREGHVWSSAVLEVLREAGIDARYESRDQ